MSLVPREEVPGLAYPEAAHAGAMPGPAGPDVAPESEPERIAQNAERLKDASGAALGRLALVPFPESRPITLPMAKRNLFGWQVNQQEVAYGWLAYDSYENKSDKVALGYRFYLLDDGRYALRQVVRMHPGSFEYDRWGLVSCMELAGLPQQNVEEILGSIGLLGADPVPGPASAEHAF